MLTITIPALESWNEVTQEFVTSSEQVLNLEHSLLSISKWESKYHKSFLGKNEKTNEEMVYYVKCMTINKNVDPNCYYALTRKNMSDICDYITDSMTATKFFDYTNPKNTRSDTITSELIYYWMIVAQIPFDPCQKWHLNRLLTLIRIYNVKNNTEKINPKDLAKRNAALNASRRASLKTRG